MRGAVKVYPNEHSGLLQKWDTEAWKSLSEGVALTILIVDDEPAVLSYIAAIVRKEGYEVLQADEVTKPWRFANRARVASI